MLLAVLKAIFSSIHTWSPILTVLYFCPSRGSVNVSPPQAVKVDAMAVRIATARMRFFFFIVFSVVKNCGVDLTLGVSFFRTKKVRNRKHLLT